jgi:hypothetical protein
MSSITPTSFVDDGSSFEKRILHPSHNPKWLSTSASDTTSAYTGSYIDDGADLLLPSRRAPGFGPINPKFYKQRKRKENENGLWNDDIQKAVAGDIARSLEKMRGIGGVEVKRPTGDRIDEREKKRKDTVTILLPRRWGTFVIKANDGRVIVVDEDGEFDSGPQLQQQSAKWVKALTTISIPPSSPRKDKKTGNRHLEPMKSLIPIPESEYEDGYIPFEGEDTTSPTGFFMTGGANGWPSRSASSIKSRRSSRYSLLLKPQSPVRSPPGSWPSPPQSPVTDTSSAESWGKGRSHLSEKSHRSSRSGDDDVSTKSYSTYKPATVEDGSDMSEKASLVKEGGWRGSQKSKRDDWSSSHKGSEDRWGGSKKSSRQSWGSNKHSSIGADIWPEQPPANTHPAPSVIQNWIGDRVKTISEASMHKSQSHGHKSRSHSRTSSTYHAPSSEATWDGYEKPKSMSEVSIAGSGSARSCKQTDDWKGSQEANVDGRGGERTDSQSGSGAGKSRYSKGYDEDDLTYSNDDWSGVKVRVRSRKGSVNVRGRGWDE